MFPFSGRRRRQAEELGGVKSTRETPRGGGQGLGREGRGWHTAAAGPGFVPTVSYQRGLHFYVSEKQIKRVTFCDTLKR